MRCPPVFVYLSSIDLFETASGERGNILERTVATPRCSIISMNLTSCPPSQQFQWATALPAYRDVTIHKFYKLIGHHPPRPTKDQTEPLVKRQENAPGHKSGTFESFIDVLKNTLREIEGNELEIYQRRSLGPLGHPRGSRSRPDAAIFRRAYSFLPDEDKISWSSVEMVIEYNSGKTDHKTCFGRTANFVMYLLEARPDLVLALGLLVNRDCVDFCFCNVEGIYKVTLSNGEDYLPLLSTVMRYLNGGQKKNSDPTLSRVPGTALFDVSIPTGAGSVKGSGDPPITYKSCSLRYSNDPFGRRPNVFVYKPGHDVTAIRVIKDQYLGEDQCWTEKYILTKIHANGTYPSVARMCFASEITSGRCGDRIRVRMCLQDYGRDFLSLKTPREVLYAIYDLLEVTRSLYLDRKILHCDINPWNFMIRDSDCTQDVETSSSASPVFIQHLLDPQISKHKSTIFLIDFGYSQDFELCEPRSQERSSTPTFAARAVHAGRTPSSRAILAFPELPPLSEGIRASYESNYPRRVKLFHGPFTPQIGRARNPPPSLPFHHKLAHDAESAIWTCFWWCIQALPENETSQAKDFIDELTWLSFMPQYSGPRNWSPEFDSRNNILYMNESSEKVFFHRGYEKLEELFQDISPAILPDYHWAEDTIRQRPDFVHEILQRIILNFIVDNMDAPFMDKKKASKNRRVYSIRF